MLDSWTRYRVNSQDEGRAAGLAVELAAHGLVLLDDVTSADHLLRLAHSIATIVPHRDSDASGLTTIADIGGQMRSGFAGFSACALNPHTDRSGTVNPPALPMMACGQPASTGGECVVIDGKGREGFKCSAVRTIRRRCRVSQFGFFGHRGSDHCSSATG